MTEAPNNESLEEALEQILENNAAHDFKNYPKDRAELAVEAGFNGTLAEFLDWLEESLVYGGIIRKPIVDNYGREKIQVDLITGGYSSDERLLGRVFKSPYMSTAWRSSHAGGLYVYEFHKEWFNWAPTQWLAPNADHPFEIISAVRKVRIIDSNDQLIEFDGGFETGVELVFEEGTEDGRRDFSNLSGILTVRPWSGKID